MDIGLQTWTIRELFFNSPEHAIKQCHANLQCPGFDFLELAGTGLALVESLGAQLEKVSLPVKGAHICSLAARPDAIGEIAAQYITAFPALEWFAFFLDPNDLSEMSLSATKRLGVYRRYAEQLHRYKDTINRVCDNLNLATPKQRRPTVVYHTFAPDFWPLDGGDPAFAALLGAAEIQLDNYFANISTFNLASWLHSVHSSPRLRDQLIFHSMHISGIDSAGRHAALPNLIRPSVMTTDIVESIRAFRNLGGARLIIEHELNPLVVMEAAVQSLHSIRALLSNSTWTQQLP